MAKIPHTFVHQGRYYYRRRANLTKSLAFVVTLSLHTREPVQAAHRAAALSLRFAEVLKRVTMFIRQEDFLSHEMAKEIFDRELRACLDDLILGYFANPDPSGVADAYRTAAAAYRIARTPGASMELSEEQRARLLQQGFTDRSIDNVACDLDRLAHAKNLSDSRIDDWIAAFGTPPSRASYGAVASHMVRAHGRAHELASRYLDPDIQDTVDPVSALLSRAHDDTFQMAGTVAHQYPEAEPTLTEVVPPPSPPPTVAPQQCSQFFLSYCPIPFADIIDEVAASLKADGRWNGDISQQKRIMRSFGWITGNKALGDYTHLDVAKFKSALQLLPRDFKFHEHFDQPYELAAAKVRQQIAAYETAKENAAKTGKPIDPKKVRAYIPRQRATINRDLSFMSSVSDHLAMSHWAPIVPNAKILDFTKVLVKNVKAKGTVVRSTQCPLCGPLITNVSPSLSL